jgi:hypothetical protein
MFQNYFDLYIIFLEFVLPQIIFIIRTVSTSNK